MIFTHESQRLQPSVPVSDGYEGGYKNKTSIGEPTKCVVWISPPNESNAFTSWLERRRQRETTIERGITSVWLVALRNETDSRCHVSFDALRAIDVIHTYDRDRTLV